MTTTVVGEQPAGVAPPREWWQVWAQRRAQWWAARPVLAGRWAKVRAVGLWVGPRRHSVGPSKAIWSWRFPSRTLRYLRGSSITPRTTA